MRFQRLLNSALKIAVSVGLLLLVLRSVDLAKLRQDLGQLEIGRMTLLIVVGWIGQLFCAQRWRLFASSLGMDASYRTFFQMYFAGMFFNVGLPSLVGGDLIKAYMISRKTGKGLHCGLASVSQDRAAGLISLLLYGSAAVIAHPVSWRGIPLWFIYLALWIGVIFVLWLVYKGDVIYRRFALPGRIGWFHKLVGSLAEFHRALGILRLSPGATLQVIGYSFLNSALVLWMFQQVSVAAQTTLPLVAFSALFPLISVATLLPMSLGGIGIREWAYVEGLALLHVPRAEALTVALASSALIMVSDLAGIFFLPAIPAELRKIR